jgi:hypothetical protein
MTVPTPIQRWAPSPPLEGMEAASAAHHSRHLNVIVQEFWQQSWKPAFRISLYDLHHFYVPLKAL